MLCNSNGNSMVDRTSSPAEIKKRNQMATCFGCRSEIFDQYILQVAPDMEWHASCLKCAACNQFLDENCTCFVKEKKTYCKKDYMRLFGAKCSKCSQSFSKNDFVMRARNKMYHPDCFCCVSCEKPLVSGDEFAIKDDHLLCKADHEVFVKGSHRHFLQDLSSPPPGMTETDMTVMNSVSPLSNSNSSINSATGSTGNSNHGPSNKMHLTANTEKIVRHRESGRPHGHKNNPDHKPTRVRTVLNERQLQTLRQCYNNNPRPDALMKEQLVEMTGLSPRVIRVWFQNKRCKDKKRTVLMKQLAQQERDGRHMQNIVTMRGVSLVASSPVRHDSPVQQPLDVQSYHPPWKAFADYALHHDVDPNAPHFQHLVNQMHGFDVGLPSGPPNGSAEPHLVSLHGPHHSQTGGPCTPLSYLHDHELHNPHSNLSSHVPRTPSELSSPCTSE